MARIEISRKDGAPSPYYWSDDDGSEPRSKTVYKKTRDGRKRMRGVHYDPVTRRIIRDEVPGS